jgi:hypothetical protein
MHLVRAIHFTIRASIAVMLIAGFAQMAEGEVLFNGAIPPGEIDDIGFNDPDAGGQRLAEDFQVGSVSIMTGVTFLGGYYPTSTPGTDLFTLTILGDALGLPDPSDIIAEIPIEADRTDTGVNAQGIRLYSYESQFPGVQLDASTPYWFMIVNDTSSDPNDDWVWAGRHAGGIYARSFDGGETWFDTPEGGFSFQVLGEPGATPVVESTWGLLKARYQK